MHPPKRIHLQSHLPLQKPGFSCSADLMMQCRQNPVLPQPGAGCQSGMQLSATGGEARRGSIQPAAAL